MTRRTVLVVDDQADLRVLLDAILTNGDTRVAVAPDVTSALALIGTLSVDVIVTDHAMPERTGLDLARICAKRIPTIVVSAYLTPQVLADYQAVGVTEVFDKPLDVLKLRATVRRLAGLA